MGVIILVITGCESSTPVEALNEQREGTTPELLTQLSSKTLEMENQLRVPPGIVDPLIISDNLRKMLKKYDINVDSLEYNGLPKNAKWLVGKEAWDTYFEGSIDTGQAGSKNVKLSGNNPQFTTNSAQTAMTGAPTPAYTEFMVTEGFGSPSSGSVTVKYQGEQVTTTYTSSDSPFSVASMISHKINDDADIQLTSTSTMTDVRVTEKWPGCEHNGNIVHISSSTGTHISINDTEFFMDGGTDDGIGCAPPDPLSSPQLLSPPNNSVDQPTSLTLDWEPVDGATTYGLQVALNSDFTNLIIDESGILSTSGNVSDLNYTTTYFWRVKAFNAMDASEWSSVWNFTTDQPPVQLTAGSTITTPCCENFGPVDMASASFSNVPIQFIGVIGTSFKDFLPIMQLADGGQNRTFATVGFTYFKSAFDPQIFWQQFGDHEFTDPSLDGTVFIGSHDQTHF